MEDNKQDQEMPFIKEKIKDKPIDKRRLLLHILWVMLCAVIFGLISCVTFVIVRPKLEGIINPVEQTPITIPKDSAPDASAAQNGTGKEDDAAAADESESSQKSDETEKETVVIKEELEPTNYQSLTSKIYAVGRKANKSVVTVTAFNSDFNELLQQNYEKANKAAGIIFESNKNKLLILTEVNNLAGAEKISITFINGDVVPANIEQYDGNTGIAVVSALKKEIPSAVMNSIEEIELGNALSVSQGTVVLAVGSPQGSIYSILSGTVTASNIEQMTWDSTYSFFMTDMVGSMNSSGVLINLDGEVIGFLLQNYQGVESTNTISAISVSELKDKELLQSLSNGKNIPHLGLKLETVSDAIAEQESIPKGVFISEIRPESPAAVSGLQIADIIVELGGEEIMTVDQYTDKLFSLRPEQEVSIKYLRLVGEEYAMMEGKARIGVLQ